MSSVWPVGFGGNPEKHWPSGGVGRASHEVQVQLLVPWVFAPYISDTRDQRPLRTAGGERAVVRSWEGGGENGWSNQSDVIQIKS